MNIHAVIKWEGNLHIYIPFGYVKQNLVIMVDVCVAVIDNGRNPNTDKLEQTEALAAKMSC